MSKPLSDEALKTIRELDEQVTAFDAFEAVRFGKSTKRGARFLELYAKAAHARGCRVSTNDRGEVEVTPDAIMAADGNR